MHGKWRIYYQHWK